MTDAPKLLLDACVLFPLATREILLGYAKAGGFAPLWSERILEEWARAAARRGDQEEARARGDAALMGAWFPSARVEGWEVMAGDELPDPADEHVLAAARIGGAEAILTFNLRDFPARVLAEHGVIAVHPDAFLRDAWGRDRARLEAALGPVIEVAGGELRRFLKRAALPRLGKAVERDGLG